MGRKLTPEERAAASARAKWSTLLRRQNERFYIALSCKGAWDPTLRPWPSANGGYRRYVWPKLFLTREIAEQAAELLNPFKHGDTGIPGRGRIVSYTIEKTRLRPRVTS